MAKTKKSSHNYETIMNDRLIGLLLGIVAGDTLRWLSIMGISALAFLLTPSDSRAEKIAEGTYASAVLGGKQIPYTIHAPTGEFDGKPLPMVIYLRNLPIERIGTTSDEELIKGFLAQNMMVAEVDYQKQDIGKNGQKIYHECVDLFNSFGALMHRPPYSLKINNRQNIIAKQMKYITGEKGKPTWYLSFTKGQKKYVVSVNWVYIVPEGFTVIRDIEVMKLHYPPPRNRIRMDLIVPSKPRRPVPLVLEVTASETNKGSAEVGLLDFNAPYVFSYSLFGYATGVVSLVYEFDTGIGSQFAEHKAMRMLRARKQEWGLSGKIGMLGISKAAYRVVLTAGKHPGNKPAVSEAQKGDYPYNVLFRSALCPWLQKNYPEEIAAKTFPIAPADNRKVVEELDLGPYPKENDKPDAIMICDMADLWALPFVDKDFPPTIYSVGQESFSIGRRRITALWKPLEDFFKAQGVKDTIFLCDPKRGHEFNDNHYDEFKAFFDKYLK